MTTVQDAQTLDLLETQCRELTGVLMQLERARRDLVPDTAVGQWRGVARYAFDASVGSLAQSLEWAADALRSARDHSRMAITAMAARG